MVIQENEPRTEHHLSVEWITNLEEILAVEHMTETIS
jgi:hypothetical protein